MDRHTELALRTWYPKDHPLHKDLRPAIMGLLGEAGEIVDLVKKYTYKYEKPVDRDKLLEELGDYWYYLRIALYICGLEAGDLKWTGFDDEYCLNDTQGLSINLCVFSVEIYRSFFFNVPVNSAASDALETLRRIIESFYCSIDELTELNYAKLSGGKHGWQEHGA